MDYPPVKNTEKQEEKENLEIKLEKAPEKDGENVEVDNKVTKDISDKIIEHRKKYSIDNSSEQYFTPDQIKYYDKKFANYDQGEKVEKVHEWSILKQIGKGSFGSVYQGFDSIKGRPIAIKQLDIENNNKSKSKVEALELEIDLLTRLNHKNIVTYHGCEIKDNKLYIFLEFVGGGSLQKALEEYGELHEKLIKKYTKQILDGLEYLHYKRVIHRDIKAANILVHKGVCKLTDFGASKKIVDDYSSEKFKSFIGTPYWMAPEVIKQTGHSRFADIWSLG